MSIRSIMVHVDLGPSATSRVRFASWLADRFDARLIGATGTEPLIPMMTESSYVDDKLMTDAAAAAQRTLDEAETLFRQAVCHRNAVEWRGAIGRATDILVENARAADVIVIGRQGAEDHSDWRLAVDAGDLLMGAGRSILVSPKTDDYRGRNVLIAWSDTTEARRAVKDALPLLHAADSISVMSVGAEPDATGVKDVLEWLKLHGLNAEARFRKSPVESTGDEIVRAAEDGFYDLIVSGAYGHSRLREWILGGVTHTLLQRTPVPCFMSH